MADAGWDKTHNGNVLLRKVPETFYVIVWQFQLVDVAVLPKARKCPLRADAVWGEVPLQAMAS
jgi:hypothetical protein